MAGLTGNNNLIASSIQYVINVFMTIFALLYIDRWGRRWPLLIGATFMSIFMYGNAGLLATYGSPAPPGGIDNIAEQSWQISGAPARAVIAFTYLFVASFAPTWGPVSWIYPPELFPLRVRGKAVALTTSSNWIFNFALSYFVPPAFVNIKASSLNPFWDITNTQQWKTYIIFGVFLTAMTIHVFFCFPETAGKTLEQVEEIFTSQVKPWNTHVDYNRAVKEEHGDVDPEKKLSYVQHVDHSTSTPSAPTAPEVERKEAAQEAKVA